MSNSSPEYEKAIQKEYAIQNVRKEIRLLETRMNDFNQQIKEINAKCLEKLTTLTKKKLHKSQETNEIISNSHEEYLHITHEYKIDGRSIVAGCVYYIHGLPLLVLLVHKILELLFE